METLLNMGFEKSRIESAISATKCTDEETLINWLLSNETSDKPAAEGHILGGDSDEKSNEAQANDNVAKSLKCEDCGKLFKSPEAAELHASRTQHVNFSESTSEIKPLTEEEKQVKKIELQEKLATRRQARLEEEQREKIEREKLRRKDGQMISNMKADYQYQEAKKLAEARKREKEEERLALQRARDMVEKDRAERRLKAAGKSAEVAQSTPPVVASPSPQNKTYDEARLQIRFRSGAKSIVGNFSPKEPLSAVRLFIELNRTDGIQGQPFTLSVSFPRKTFEAEDYEKSLLALGLVPSAVLVVSN